MQAPPLIQYGVAIDPNEMVKPMDNVHTRA